MRNYRTEKVTKRPAGIRTGDLSLTGRMLFRLSHKSRSVVNGVRIRLSQSILSPSLTSGHLGTVANTWAVGLARRCRRWFDPRFRSFSLSSTSKFSSLSSTSIFISSRCSFSCHSPRALCPAPVCSGCLFRLFLSLLSPSSQPPIDRVSPNVALKLVTKPILWNRLSGLSD